MQKFKRLTFFFFFLFFPCASVCLFAKHQVACSPMCYDCFICHLGTQYKISQGVCSTTKRKEEKKKKKDTNCFLSSLVFKATPQTMHLIIYRTVYSFVPISTHPLTSHCPTMRIGVKWVSGLVTPALKHWSWLVSWRRFTSHAQLMAKHFKPFFFFFL